MHFLLTTVALLTPVIAFPIPLQRTPPPECPDHQAIDILEYNQDTQYLKFSLPCHDCNIADASADKPLVFDLQVNPCDNNAADECFDVAVNGKHIISQSNKGNDHSSVTQSVVELIDLSEHQRTISLRATLLTNAQASTERPLFTSRPWWQEAQFDIGAVDGSLVGTNIFSVRWKRSMNGQAEFAVMSIVNSDMTPQLIYPQCYEQRQDTRTKSFIDVPEDNMEDMDDMEEAEYLASELEVLRLLEQDALNLQNEITIRKQVVSTRVASYRSRKSLEQLIQQCDGIVCAAHQIATRIYDKINLATASDNDYANLQRLTQTSTPPPNPESAGQTDTTTNQSFRGNLGTFDNDGYLLKALAYIASILGLLVVFRFVKRKCMSMRNRVERAADLEERRNARAYRKAARRAEMRKRWSDFLQAFNYFKIKQEEPRLTNYDEKRALILQDALLEQDFSQLEQGDIMEAEIRQLRNAHEIVSGIMLRHGAPIKDPPPSLIPLPVTRSRASTGTLPSYSSEDPPDYSSISEHTGENTTTDGFAYYQPTTHYEEPRYVAQAPTSTSSNGTGSTPISSIAVISRRPSTETLFTRLSRVDSCGSTTL